MNLVLFIPEITLVVFAILVILLDLGVRQKAVLGYVSLAGLIVAGGFSLAMLGHFCSPFKVRCGNSLVTWEQHLWQYSISSQL